MPNHEIDDLESLASNDAPLHTGLFGHPLRDPARRKVHHQSFSHTLFMHDDSGHERTHQQGAQCALALLSLLVFQNVL